mmetsp:Transcript_8760/g.19576  ORF Transcript_8760/g.19576 Transcript_8760/m.19576 type:complete len:205 (+) Transcript_8760:841-1455(+)
MISSSHPASEGWEGRLSASSLSWSLSSSAGFLLPVFGLGSASAFCGKGKRACKYLLAGTSKIWHLPQEASSMILRIANSSASTIAAKIPRKRKSRNRLTSKPSTKYPPTMMTEKTRKTMRAIGPHTHQLKHKPQLKFDEQQQSGLLPHALQHMQQKHVLKQLKAMEQHVVQRMTAKKTRSIVVYMAKTQISSKFLLHGQFKNID